MNTGEPDLPIRCTQCGANCHGRFCPDCGAQVAASLADDAVPMQCQIWLPRYLVAGQTAAGLCKITARAPIEDLVVEIGSHGFVRPDHLKAGDLWPDRPSGTQSLPFDVEASRAGGCNVHVRVTCNLPGGEQLAVAGDIGPVQVVTDEQLHRLMSQHSSRQVTIQATRIVGANIGGLFGAENREAPSESLHRFLGDPSQPEQWRPVPLRRVEVEGEFESCIYCTVLSNRRSKACDACGREFPRFWTQRIAALEGGHGFSHAVRHDGLLLLPANPRLPQQYLHFKARLALGRDPGNDVLLRRLPWLDEMNAIISGRQAFLEMRDETLHCGRIGQAETHVDETRVDQNAVVALPDTCQVSFARGFLRLHVAVRRHAVKGGDGTNGSEPSRVVTCVRMQRLGQDQDVEAHYLLHRWAVLGSDDDCDIRLDAPGIAPRHARLVVMDRRLLVEPFSRRDTVLVNRHKAQPNMLTPLVPGCELALGSVTMLVRPFDLQLPLETRS